MFTVLEAIKSAADYLERKGIQSSRLNAELLLSHILNCKRLELYLAFERPLKKNEIDAYREFIKRRAVFEPLQYIIGNVQFYGLELEVNRSVLIPRPETELLVEEVISSAVKSDEKNIVDFCSGSGNIAIALAKNIPDSKIICVDISQEAIKIAQRNASQNGVDKQIEFIQKNIFNGFELNNTQFDFIVSNPPYISFEEFTKLDPELRLYEPSIALTDGLDGLSFFKKISELSKRLLKENGKIFFEMGAGQTELVKKILQQNEFHNIMIKKDYSGIERIIIGEKI